MRLAPVRLNMLRLLRCGIRFAAKMFACLIPLLAVSCTNMAPWQRMNQKSDLGTGIASVGGMDKPAQAHVETLLLQHGIHCAMEGSIIYGVWVAPKDAARALRILRQDLKLRPFDITLWEGDVGEQYSSPAMTLN